VSRKNPSPIRVTSRLGSLALKHLRPEHVDTALGALKEHIAGLPDGHPVHADNDAAMQYCDRFFEGAATGAPETAAEHTPSDWRDQARSVSEQPDPVDRRAASAALQRQSGYRW
jgi:hypothetical protein